MSIDTSELKPSYLNESGCANCNFNNNQPLISDIMLEMKGFWNELVHDGPEFDY